MSELTSFIFLSGSDQSLCAPDPDPQLVVTHYTRSWEQNEELGLNDMKTENYEES